MRRRNRCQHLHLRPNSSQIYCLPDEKDIRVRCQAPIIYHSALRQEHGKVSMNIEYRKRSSVNMPYAIDWLAAIHFVQIVIAIDTLTACVPFDQLVRHQQVMRTLCRVPEIYEIADAIYGDCLTEQNITFKTNSCKMQMPINEQTTNEIIIIP